MKPITEKNKPRILAVPLLICLLLLSLSLSLSNKVVVCIHEKILKVVKML